jgi:hypothetical protein
MLAAYSSFHSFFFSARPIAVGAQPSSHVSRITWRHHSLFFSSFDGRSCQLL